MRIGLIDVDGHRFPNLCLMKLSAYHKARGDMVEWHESGKHYDLVYMSRVFTDTILVRTYHFHRLQNYICFAPVYNLNIVRSRIVHTLTDVD